MYRKLGATEPRYFKRIHLGYFDTAEAAYEGYLKEKMGVDKRLSNS